MKLNYKLTLLVLISCLYGITDAQNRIVGGTTTKISKYPYMLGILQADGTYFCAASLITRKNALSAAHCVVDKLVSELIVVAGVTDLGQKGQRRGVNRMWIPEGFDLTPNDFDVAVLEFRRPMVLGVNVAIIPLGKTRLKAGMRMRVSGWGKTSENGKTAATKLHTVVVQIIGYDKCASQYEKSNTKITSTMLCAGHGDKDACNGDSGAPAVVNGKQYGIVSFGKGCGRKEYPGVYTKIMNADVRGFIYDCIRQ
ncbi:PREDICTED: trypsin beta-like [Bactrocera latifrons]|uniref:Mite allergen Der p 3 n=1 Tax=Bactrocera latifrons TaxID=174628 RepID=A0A0K8WEL3_BACLA|nr:PREDICTED: trypsin beta-like [Bactrocera latifrons]